MKKLIPLLLLTLPAHAEQLNIWLAVADTSQALVAEAVSIKAATEAAAAREADKGVIDKLGKLVGMEAIAVEPATLRDEAYAKLDTAQQKAVDELRKTHDGDVVQSLFKRPVIKSRTWTLYSLYPDAEDVNSAIKDAVTAFAGDVKILGAWTMDGKQLVPTDPETLNFMPDVCSGEPVVCVPATELTDVNFLGGQKPRDFTP